VDQLDAPAEEESAGANEKRIGSLARELCKGRIDLAAAARLENLESQSQGGRRRIQGA
jgi:hypothetical protein